MGDLKDMAEAVNGQLHPKAREALEALKEAIDGATSETVEAEPSPPAAQSMGNSSPPPKWCPFASCKPARMSDGAIHYDGAATPSNRYDMNLPTVHWPMAAACIQDNCALWIAPKITSEESQPDGSQVFHLSEGRCGLRAPI